MLLKTHTHIVFCNRDTIEGFLQYITIEGFLEVAIKRLARLGFEPTTTEFRSGALTNRAIRS